jgi:hypothetical protein
MKNEIETLKLRPCPFCQSNNEILKSNDLFTYIFCCQCGCHGPIGKTFDDTIERWNARIPEIYWMMGYGGI